MKLHLGYIFSKGIHVIDSIGLNEWILNEGRADRMDYHTVDDNLGYELNLSEGASDRWAKLENERDNPPEEEISVNFNDLFIKAREKAGKLERDVYVIEATPFEYWFATDDDYFSKNEILFKVFYTE